MFVIRTYAMEITKLEFRRSYRQANRVAKETNKCVVCPCTCVNVYGCVWVCVRARASAEGAGPCQVVEKCRDSKNEMARRKWRRREKTERGVLPTARGGCWGHWHPDDRARRGRTAWRVWQPAPANEVRREGGSVAKAPGQGDLTCHTRARHRQCDLS